MSISGSLQDVSVADVMQFIHLGRRTGTLVLRRSRERALIGFHLGKLVSAQAPRTPQLGELLVEAGLVEPAALAVAVTAQEQALERRTLGQTLVAGGAIEPQALRNAVVRQIEQAVSEVIAWDRGTFEFAVGDLRPVDDVALYPGDVIPDADINTQMVLLEAARIFDERNRLGGEGSGEAGGERRWPGSERPAVPPPATSPAAAAARVRAALAAVVEEEGDELEQLFAAAGTRPAVEAFHLQVVSADRAFAARVTGALGEHRDVAGARAVTLAEAGKVPPGDPPPIVLLDLRQDGVTLSQVVSLRRARPGASVVAVVEPGMPLAKVYAAGALAAIPAETEAVVACVENLVESRREAAGGANDPRSGVARLRRVFGDLRSGLISATVALNLMHIISESVERAVLFLVRREQMVALGAFGADREGRSLAELTRGMKLPLDDESVLSVGYQTGEVQSVPFEDARLPEPFGSLVGRPKNGQVVVFPVLGAQRVISLIYADNGERDDPVEDIDILELATAQVGMAFENELLRRQISQSKG
ncbi:MAG TPA: DUF4388 domain-containing protein [Thermoanaerobaculia bacterium]